MQAYVKCENRYWQLAYIRWSTSIVIRLVYLLWPTDHLRYAQTPLTSQVKEKRDPMTSSSAVLYQSMTTSCFRSKSYSTLHILIQKTAFASVKRLQLGFSFDSRMCQILLIGQSGDNTHSVCNAVVKRRPLTAIACDRVIGLCMRLGVWRRDSVYATNKQVRVAVIASYSRALPSVWNTTTLTVFRAHHASEADGQTYFRSWRDRWSDSARARNKFNYIDVSKSGVLPCQPLQPCNDERRPYASTRTASCASLQRKLFRTEGGLELARM